MSFGNLTMYESVERLVVDWINSDIERLKTEIVQDGLFASDIIGYAEDIAKLRDVLGGNLESFTAFVIKQIQNRDDVNPEADTYYDFIEDDPDFIHNCFWEFEKEGRPAYIYDSNKGVAKIDKGLALKNAMCDLGIKLDDFVNKHGEATARIAGAGLIGLMANQNGKDAYDSAKEAGAFFVAFNYRAVMDKIHDFFAKQDNAFAKLMITDLGDALRNKKADINKTIIRKIDPNIELGYKEICDYLRLEMVDYSGSAQVFWDDELNKATLVTVDPFGDSTIERFDTFEEMFYCNFSDIITNNIKENGFSETFSELLQVEDFEFLDKLGYFNSELNLKASIGEDYKNYKKEMGLIFDKDSVAREAKDVAKGSKKGVVPESIKKDVIEARER